MLIKKRFWWLPLLFSLLAIVITANFSIFEFNFFDQKKIVQSAVLLITSLFFLTFLFRYKMSGLKDPIWWSFGIFFLILLIISSVLAPLPEWAFLQVGWYLLLGQLLFLNAYLYSENKDRYVHLVLWAVIALCVLYCLRVYTDHLTSLLNENWSTWPHQSNVLMKYHGEILNPNAYLGFLNIRFFNHIQTWSLPILVLGYCYFRDRMIPGLRYLLLFFISSWWMLVFAADARGTMVASFVSLLFVGVLFKKKSLRFVKPYLMTAGAGLILYVILFLLLTPDAKEILTRFTGGSRWEAWQFSFQKIMEYPWLGLGPMHFSYEGFAPPLSTPHNLILQSATEWGIPAVLIAIGLSIWALYAFIRQSARLAKEKEYQITITRIALIASISAALVHSTVSGIFNSQLSQLLFTIIGGWMLGDYFLRSERVLFVPRTKKTVALGVLLLLLFVNSAFVGYKVFSEVPHLEERKAKFFRRYQTLKLFPRFWSQGILEKKESGTKKKGGKETGGGN